ncbi:hypothetical protein [Halopiger goleimassiliensis]|uniref:hypothetical protein n=1 Tax=Halopiger goleimassiliensis TaxID=1293048 RepID=UPI000677A9C0|nr:hypothetical protein [Halopiger goleimassiliensis]
MKYCLHCDWFADATTSERDPSRLALEHFVETGHTIDTSDSVGRPTPPAICEAVVVRDLLDPADDTSHTESA